MAFPEKIVLSDKQLAYLDRHFKNTKNAELAAKLGISWRSVVRIARKRGLEKTPQFRRKCQRACADAAIVSHLTHGTYPPKGYKIPGSEKGQFKPGETPRHRLGKRKDEARIKKAAATLAKTRKLEHARWVWGLDQQTNLRVGKQSIKRIQTRYYLKKRGYVLVENPQTGSWAYWTAETRRALRLEASKEWHFFHFAPLPPELAGM